MTHHLDAAERHLEAVEAAELHRQEIYADREIPDRADQLERIGRAIRHGMAMARVHAELAIAEQLGASVTLQAEKAAGIIDKLMTERYGRPFEAVGQ